MSDNPYQSPAADSGVLGITNGTREDLRKVAKYQKGILICILIYLVALASQFGLPPAARPILALGLLLIGFASTVFVFLLALKVYSTGWGITLGILTLIPCLNLIVLLAINGKATQLLRQNGIRVGLMGANLSQIS